jgi:uncharacterized protein (DUF697 family)
MKLLGKAGGGMGAVGTVRSFMNVVKDIDFDEVRDRAEQSPRTLLVGADEARAEEAAAQVFGAGAREGVELRTWREGDTVDSSRWDAIIVYDPTGTGVLDKVRKAVGSGSDDVVFFLAKPQQGGKDPVEALRAEITDTLPALAPSYGRFFESWRAAAVRAIIDETAKANAQFALVSNIPAIIPILGGLVSASADLLVLTKNQVMMCYKIAAAHDRQLGNQMAVVRELTPVVGAGFLWRTAAREAASFIPFAAGTIPKVAIAFAGTMTVGRAADYYYRYGKKPSKDQLSQFAENAANLAKKLPILGEDSAQQRVEAQKELATGEAGTEKLPSNGQVPGDTGRL